MQKHFDQESSQNLRRVLRTKAQGLLAGPHHKKPRFGACAKILKLVFFRTLIVPVVFYGAQHYANNSALVHNHPTNVLGIQNLQNFGKFFFLNFGKYFFQVLEKTFSNLKSDKNFFHFLEKTFLF